VPVKNVVGWFRFAGAIEKALLLPSGSLTGDPAGKRPQRDHDPWIKQHRFGEERTDVCCLPDGQAKRGLGRHDSAIEGRFERRGGRARVAEQEPIGRSCELLSAAPDERVSDIDEDRPARCVELQLRLGLQVQSSEVCPYRRVVGTGSQLELGINRNRHRVVRTRIDGRRGALSRFYVLGRRRKLTVHV
jgi:hypothetical protein